MACVVITVSIVMTFNLVLVSHHSPLPEACPSAHSSYLTIAKSPLILTYKLLSIHCYPHKQHVTLVKQPFTSPLAALQEGFCVLATGLLHPPSVLLPYSRGCERGLG